MKTFHFRSPLLQYFTHSSFTHVGNSIPEFDGICSAGCDQSHEKKRKGGAEAKGRDFQDRDVV